MYGSNRFYRFLFLSYVTISHEEVHGVHQGDHFDYFKKCVEDRDIAWKKCRELPWPPSRTTGACATSSENRYQHLLQYLSPLRMPYY